MKKLFVLGGILIAFSAVNLFANGSNAVNNGDLQSISAYKTVIADTVPKKDTTKKKDTTSFQLKAKQ